MGTVTRDPGRKRQKRGTRGGGGEFGSRRHVCVCPYVRVTQPAGIPRRRREEENKDIENTEKNGLHPGSSCQRHMCPSWSERN